MWPRLLLEFLPHLTRLVPAADTYLSTRRKSDEALQAALTSLGDEVRSGFTKVAEDQSARDRELASHIAVSEELGKEVAHLRSVVDGLESHLAQREERLLVITRLLWAVLVLVACGTAVLAFRVWH